MAGKGNIITKDKELYDKLHMLSITNRVVMENTNNKSVDRILRKINSNETVITKTKENDKYVLNKVNPLKFNIYYRKKR